MASKAFIFARDLVGALLAIATFLINGVAGAGIVGLLFHGGPGEIPILFVLVIGPLFLNPALWFVIRSRMLTGTLLGILFASPFVPEGLGIPTDYGVIPFSVVHLFGAAIGLLGGFMSETVNGPSPEADFYSAAPAFWTAARPVLLSVLIIAAIYGVHETTQRIHASHWHGKLLHGTSGERETAIRQLDQAGFRAASELGPALRGRDEEVRRAAFEVAEGLLYRCWRNFQAMNCSTGHIPHRKEAIRAERCIRDLLEPPSENWSLDERQVAAFLYLAYSRKALDFDRLFLQFYNDLRGADPDRRKAAVQALFGFRLRRLQMAYGDVGYRFDFGDKIDYLRVMAAHGITEGWLSSVEGIADSWDVRGGLIRDRFVSFHPHGDVDYGQELLVRLDHITGVMFTMVSHEDPVCRLDAVQLLLQFRTWVFDSYGWDRAKGVLERAVEKEIDPRIQAIERELLLQLERHPPMERPY